MSNSNLPLPPSHKTMVFGKVVIDSNFDSGNCSFAEKVNGNTYAIWIAADHPKNVYRIWFYFSVQGVNKYTVVNFQIKNMQNQSKILEEGLLPVVRDSSTNQWKKISHKINLANIIYGDNQIEWTFTHQFSSSQKHYFALYYPWSNDANSQFLQSISIRTAQYKDIYFYRGTIINTVEGRPVQMLLITSKKGLTQKQQSFDDNFLFVNGSKPKKIQGEKKCIIVGARVHPGEVPGSHVMTGIIDQLTKDNKTAQLLRDHFIFYIFPIFNPDGVARGHFRLDANGINLNRCYINPSPKQNSSIYAVKKVIMKCHSQNRYFAFLDLHAQATRKGNFIYGNSINELNKQVDACLFAKILSLNSENFEYEGSNFMEKHMYLKDKSDNISKEGCGRVAVYHATKNPNSWTLECSYHMSQRINVLQPQKQEGDEAIKIEEGNLDQNLIKNYKASQSVEADQCFSIQNYRDLGREILESLLDLVELNPYSRVTNPNNHFKSIANIKLSLALALVKMAPNRFEPHFRKVFFMLQTENEKIVSRCFKALYLMIMKKATIPQLAQFLREQDNSVVYPVESTKQRANNSFRKGVNRYSHKPQFTQNQAMLQANLNTGDDSPGMQSTNSITFSNQESPQKIDSSPQSCYSQILHNDRRKPNKESKSIIKIVEIDKQIYLKKVIKQQIRLFGINHKQSRYEVPASNSRNEFQGQITNFGDYKNKGRARNQIYSMRKTYNQAFKIQILPKLISSQKTGNNVVNGTILLHHKSLK